MSLRNNDVLHGLEGLFKPRALAVIGATDRAGAVGRTIVENLKKANAISTKPTKISIFPVNPARDVCCDLTCYHSVELCPSPVDLAVIVTPAKTVKDVVESCGKARVPIAIIISAGFKEIGSEGLELENSVLEVAERYNVRLIGPNCLGVMSPHSGMNATFAATDALPGNLAFMSQSGAMCTAVLDWSLKENVGFSAFVSIGSMADVNWGDLIDYLGNDTETHCILIYMETIGHAGHFLSAARQVAAKKPIIVIKAGQTEAAAQAAASHTGSLAGSHDAFLAAMSRAGVLVVDTIGELFDCALVLGKQPRPRGENLLVITNAGGPGVLATDAASLSGAKMASLSSETVDTMNTFLPPAWSHANPIDILGDASADLYAKTLKIALADKASDGVLIILSPQSVTDCTGTARKVIEAFNQLKSEGCLVKPLMCSWMGGPQVSEGFELLNVHGIPTFPYPDSAARIFGKLWTHTKALQVMQERPGTEIQLYSHTDRKQKAVSILEHAISEGRNLLTEFESKEILRAYEIPIADTIICVSEEATLQAAERIGYPVVVKLHSESITHKSDVGGVKLNLHTKEDVRLAWISIKEAVTTIGLHHFNGVTVQPMIQTTKGIELIIGSFEDAQFGPLILFGAGGCMVEIFKDRSLGLPPLNLNLCRRLVESTNISVALKGNGNDKRFPKIHLESLYTIILKFSSMVEELHNYLFECDINPLLAMENNLVALDARIVLRQNLNKHVNSCQLSIPKLAIRPYPKEYIFDPIKLNNGEQLNIRPIHNNDIHFLYQLFSLTTEEYQDNKHLQLYDFILKITSEDYDRVITLGAFHQIQDLTDRETTELVAFCSLYKQFKRVSNSHKQSIEITLNPLQTLLYDKAIIQHLLTKAFIVAENEHVETVQMIIEKEMSVIRDILLSIKQSYFHLTDLYPNMTIFKYSRNTVY